MKKRLINNKYCIISTAITFSIMIIIMVFFKIAPFGEYSFTCCDASQQYMPFFSEFIYKLKSGESLYYSFNGGMGYDFFSLFLYYLVSPVNLIAVFFDNKDLPSFMSIIIMLKIVLASTSMSYYFTNRKDGNDSIINVALSVSYSLSGFICGYYYNIMWLDAIVILPILVLGLERLIYDKKPIMYIICLVLSMLCNFYMAFMSCIFITIWFIKILITDLVCEKKWKEAIRCFVSFIIYSVLSAGTSAIFLIPAYLSLQETNASNDTAFSTMWYGNIFSLLSRHIFLTRPIQISIWSGLGNVYCGMIVIIMFFVFVMSSIKLRYKIADLILVVFMVISMNNTYLNFVWHGFHNQNNIPNRFSVFYIFALLVIASNVFDNLKFDVNRKIIAIAVAFVFPIVCFVFVDFDGMISSSRMILISMCLVIIYGVFLILGDVYPQKKKALTIGITSLIILEIGVNSFVTIGYNDLNNEQTFLNYILMKEKNIQKIRKEDSSFYREEIYNATSVNEAVFMNIKGTSLFSSTASGDLVNTMSKVGYMNATNYFGYVSSPVLEDIYGVKYIYSYDDHYSNKNDYSLIQAEETESNGYKYNSYTYLNEDVLPLGFCVNNETKNIQLNAYHYASNINHLVESMTNVEDVYSPVSFDFDILSSNGTASYDQEKALVHYSPDDVKDVTTLVINTTIDKDGWFFCECKNPAIYDIGYYINDELISGDDVGNSLFDLGYLQSGTKFTAVVNLAVTELEGGDVGFLISEFNENNWKKANELLHNNNMDVSDYSSNEISGTINLDSQSLLMITIPFSDGWTIYDNGKPTDSFEVCGAFTGIELEPGNHHIYMKYRPKGISLGLVISIVSLIVLTGIMFFCVKTKHTDLGEKNNLN